MLGRMLARTAKEAVGVEPFGAHDGQGKPTYSASQNIEARVVEEDDVVIGKDGSDVRTRLTLWIEPDEDPIPDENDRLTYDGRTFIAVEKVQGRRARGSVVYWRVRATDE